MRGRVAVLAGVLMLALTLGDLPAQQPSWPQWRGPSRDGVAAFDAPREWPAALRKAWEAPVGLGHASPVIAAGTLVVHAREGGREVVRAFDVETGAAQWRQAYDAPYQVNSAAQLHGPGPKSTPAIAGSRVFTLGISGILTAMDLASGKVLWRTAASPVLPLYGTATSPLVEGDRVIAFMGGHDQGALTAFDAATGTVRWRWTGDGPGYASPVVAELGGVRQIITQSQRQVVGVAAATGALLWQVALRTSSDQNSVTPLVLGDLVISAGLATPTIAYRVTRTGSTWAAQEAWRNDQVSLYMSSPTSSARAVFGLSHRNRGQFVALDPASGQLLWSTRGREADNASVIRAGDWLLLTTTNSELIVARADASRYDEVKRYSLASSPIWAHPAVAGRTIAVKDADRVIVWKVEG